VTPAAGAALLTHHPANNGDWPPWRASNTRTLIRMLPGDDVAAAAAATLAARRRASRVWLIGDDNYEFAAARQAVRRRLAALHIRVAGTSTYTERSQAPRVARAVRRGRAQAIIFTGAVSARTAALCNAVDRDAPRVRFYAGRVETMFARNDEPGFLRRLSRGAGSRGGLTQSRVRGVGGARERAGVRRAARRQFSARTSAGSSRGRRQSPGAVASMASLACSPSSVSVATWFA
jgi:hypothetical protein